MSFEISRRRLLTLISVSAARAFAPLTWAAGEPITEEHTLFPSAVSSLHEVAAGDC